MFPSSKKIAGVAKRVSPQHLAGRLEKLAYVYGLKSTANLTLPDFLCIGFRKSGTTWLYENLHFHPDIYLPPYKNVRYFSNDYSDPLTSYAAHFAAGHDKVKGDFSNNYSFIPDRRVGFVHRIMPNLKLVVLLRNPVEREWSEFIHNVTEAHERVEALSEAEILRRLERGALLQAGGYNAVLDKWLRHFPEEQMFVGLQDDIKRDPKQLLSDIFTFLGVTHDVDWSAFPYETVIVPPVREQDQPEGYNPWRGVQVHNYTSAAKHIPEVYKAFLTAKLQPELARLSERFGDRVAHWREPVTGPAPQTRVEVTSGAT